MKSVRPPGPPAQSRPFTMETCEPRRHLSISASAEISLVSTDNSGATPVYTYDIALKNTGTTTLGTFWFAWTPGADFLATVPLSTSDPAGWSDIIHDEHSSTNGTSIEWTAASAAARVAPGVTLPGFSFTSTDSPAELAGKSLTHPATKVGTSFVYSAGAFSDSGFSFVATVADTDTTTPQTTTLAAPKPAKSYTFNKTISLSATLKTAGKTPFSGTAILTEGDEVLADATVSSKGVIKLATTPAAAIPPGLHSVQLVYSGDTTHASATSPTFTLNILKATTKLTLKASPKPTANQPLTLTASLAASSATTLPRTGTITFKDGNTTLATINLATTGNTINSALFTIPTPTLGKHTYTATYSGDPDFLTSTSAPTKVTVKP